MAVANALHHTREGLNIEAARLPNRHTSRMPPGFLAGGDDGTHKVARLKTLHRFFAHQIATRKAEFVEPGVIDSSPILLEGFSTIFVLRLQ